MHCCLSKPHVHSLRQFRMWSRFIHRALALFALAMVLAAVPMTALASGLIWADIVCCCGPHASNEACGCPDCPSAEHEEDHEAPDSVSRRAAPPSAPQLKRCGPTGTLMLMQMPVVAVPRYSAIAKAPPVVTIVVSPAPQCMQSRQADAPPVPPPRLVA